MEDIKRPKSRRRIEPSASSEQISKTERIVLWVVTIVGLISLISGFFWIKNGIKRPFSAQLAGTGGVYNINLPSEDNLLELKNKDTDEDGLNDFDELYIYNTSPYIQDSDSDGFTDSEEIESGNDPSCPAGKECQAPWLNENEGLNDELLNLYSGSNSMDMGTLRETMKAAGVPEEMLNSFDDETLQELYLQSINTPSEVNLTNTTANINSTENSNSSLVNLNEGLENTNLDLSTEDPEEFKESMANLTAEEVRELLVSLGVDEEVLSAVDDETLLDIYLQALQEQEVLE